MATLPDFLHLPAPVEAPADRYRRVRAASLALAAPLGPEDCGAQSMPDASPVKWHLAHTTWFFERFLLRERDAGYAPFAAAADFLWNSYYEAVGPRQARADRGLLTRPALGEVLEYRAHVDARVAPVLAAAAADPALAAVVALGLAHEEQHQELIVTDVKHLLSLNPLLPAYHSRRQERAATAVPMRWLEQPEGLRWTGAPAGDGFRFDNETPRHRVWLERHALASRPVTNGEYLGFVRAGGYEQPGWWLSEGWATVRQHGWDRPLYWRADLASEFTLAGVEPLDPARPVCHVSYYEADAYARWAGARLPTEHEWEALASDLPVAGHCADSREFQPRAAGAPEAGPAQLYGDVWEWTASPYVPYPGFRTDPGALGEYNGKFMCNQFVLRGGSCATPAGHVRATYRNFFPPQARWQYSGIRLARDVTC